ncbi:MAG: M20/M25/M40 family metallo-hydrolase [Bdellovibrionales bacterium]|nr:M20/M25/M40 family metallo-hydrolase [Bdellovibrionales bacterium]
MKKNLICVLFLLSFSYQAKASREVDRLTEIVNINSGTANIKGVLAVQNKIKPWFEALGFHVSLVANPEGEKVSAPMLVAEMKGEKSDTITFVMHADTVFEPSSSFQKITMKNEFIMNGPGTMDDKGGIVVVLKALEDYLVKNPKPKYSLRILVSPNEEVGSIGWWNSFHKYSESSWLVLGLEPGHDDYGIVQGRKGNIWYEINVKGKESHAGRDHKEGVNACQILATKMMEIQKLTNYKKSITTSVGRIEGGQDKYNIVCGWAKAKVDVRVPDLQSYKEVTKKMQAILKDPNITFTITDETPAFNVNKISRPVIQQYLKAIEKVEGRKVISHVSGGVGDVNHFSREGVIIMDGLGPVGGHAHTENEFLDLRTIDTRANVLTHFLQGL